MSIIASGTTTTTALVQTANTDGTLQLQVNGTTPSVTLNSLGAVGVGSTPGYGTSGQALLSSGSTSAPTWGTPSSATSATTATNLAGGSAGTVPYQSASGTTAMLSAGTSGQYLKSTGASAPVWDTPSGGFSTIAVVTSSSTWTVPDGVTKIKITAVGGGGGGGFYPGGGAGGFYKYLTVAPSGSVVIVIGAAGNTGNPGTNGGNTTVTYSGTTYTAGGGLFGQAYNQGAGGVSTNGDINIVGGPGSVFNLTDNSGGSGGTSILGGGARGGNSGTPPAAGYGGGAGGSASGGNRQGGNGVVMIEY